MEKINRGGSREETTSDQLSGKVCNRGEDHSDWNRHLTQKDGGPGNVSYLLENARTAQRWN